MLTFGPIPSRRLGRSLGIDNIPPKRCSYSCVYCQVGRTDHLMVERREFYAPATIAAEVALRLAQLRAHGDDADWLSFVPEGEPTLDARLGAAIQALRPVGLPIAVFTNASLIDRPDVRADLAYADWVCLKIDAAIETEWRRLARPHGGLSFLRIHEGMRRFARSFRGTLATETMLVEGVNDSERALEATAALVAELRPAVAYIHAPVRPPAEPWVRIPKPATRARAHEIFARRIPRVELLTGQESGRLATAGDVREELLRITAVHPLRRPAIESLLGRVGANWTLIEELVDHGELERTAWDGNEFYVRRTRRTARRRD